MLRKKRKNWTQNLCVIEAQKYVNRYEFQIRSKGAYLAAFRNGWLDNICKHMIRPINHNRVWYLINCKEEALKYNTRQDFFRGSCGAYKAAHKNKWLNEICSHMISHKKPYHYWTKEKCVGEALKYCTKKEFCENSKAAYVAASKNNWVKEICGHMESSGNVLFRCVYVYEFSDNFVYIGLTCNEKRRHCEHLKQPKSPVYLHTIKTQIYPRHKIISNGYIDVTEAQELEKRTCETYRNNGWFLLNSNRTGGVGSQKLPKILKQ